MEEKLLAALRDRAYLGACRIEDPKALAAELGISVGKLAALLYALCYALRYALLYTLCYSVCLDFVVNFTHTNSSLLGFFAHCVVFISKSFVFGKHTYHINYFFGIFQYLTAWVIFLTVTECVEKFSYYLEIGLKHIYLLFCQVFHRKEIHLVVIDKRKKSFGYIQTRMKIFAVIPVLCTEIK